MNLQREPRYEVSLDVKVWGQDRYGKPFVQHARTVNTSTAGARLIGIDCVREGEIIAVQHGDGKSRCKVIWVGRDNTPKARQIGIYCVEPDKILFGAVKKGSAMERPQVGTAFRTGSETANGPRTARRTMTEIPASRRSQQRYHCTGGVELRRNEGAPPVFGNLSDISLTGCYVETMSTLPVGNELLFMIRVRDVVLRGRSQVKTSHHAVGMGLVFLHLAKEDQQKLDFLMGTLSGIQEMRPEEQRTFVPEDPIQPVRPLTGNVVRPAATGQPPTALSIQITRTIGELNEVEQGLVKDRIDPRLIAQFHDAVEHIRQTAWSAVQWVDLNSSGGDPFEVLPQLEAERMHMLRKLAHNVTADIDAGSITRFSEGISDLFEAVEQLYRRVRKIVMDSPEDSQGSFGAHG